VQSYSRCGLYVAQTQIRNPKTNRELPFNGLFSSLPIPKGACLGLYEGTIVEDVDLDDGQFKVPSGEHYVVMGSDFVIIPQKRPDGSVDPVRFPLAMINEPPPTQSANAFFYEWPYMEDVHPSAARKRELVSAVAVHAARDIPANTEIYVNYGKHYSRKHYPRWAKPPGAEAKPLRRELLERPVHLLSR
tara:strand:+ start:354 stop:920 length:567 start_codon:yes stop_codon:yes gene_type:complete